jgi:hypothetical protein
VKACELRPADSENVRLSVADRAMIRPPVTLSLKVRLSAAVRVNACELRPAVSLNVSDSVTVLIGACGARAAVSLNVSDSVTVSANACAPGTPPPRR